MVSLKFVYTHLSKFSRFSSFILFVLMLATFALTTRASAQAVDPTCTGSPNPALCTRCKTDSGYFSANYDQCRIAVSGYNTTKLPKRLEETIVANNDCEKTGTFSSECFLERMISGTAANLVTGSVGGGVDANGNVTIGPAVDGVTYAYRTDGAVGTIISYTDKIIRPPASTGEYIAYLKDSVTNPLGTQPAYAQGLGFSSLSSVLGLWKIFRNVAYFFFVIIFLFVGFLIMFRSKIGGQAAVTVQQALPKIVVSLLLVTFSYAIVGLMVDIMYLIIYLMIGIFSSGSTGLSASSLTKIAFTDSIFANGLGLIGTTSTVSGLLKDIVVEVLQGLGWADFTALGVGLAVNLVALLVLSVALVVSLFRIFFGLLQAYVGIFFSVILAPIQLLLGAIPGQNTFGAWIKGIWTNLAVFPVVIFFIFAAHYFANQAKIAPYDAYNMNQNSLVQSLPLADGFPQANAQGLTPLQTGITTGAGGQIANAFLIFGILATLPKAMEIAKSVASGKFEFGDVGKNISEMVQSGRKSGITKALMQAPINAPVGAIAGGYAGGKVAGRGGAVAGALLGGFGATVSRAPVRASGPLLKGGLELGGKFITKQGAKYLETKAEDYELKQKGVKEEAGREADTASQKLAATTKVNPMLSEE